MTLWQNRWRRKRLADSLRYLQLARKAGCLEVGEENSGAAIRHGKAKALIMASDASDNSVRRARGFLYDKDIPLITLDKTKDELAEALGTGLCSMAALTDTGLAVSFAAALAELEPERYSEAADHLKQEEERLKQRKIEAKRCERNKKTGKRRKKV